MSLLQLLPLGIADDLGGGNLPELPLEGGGGNGAGWGRGGLTWELGGELGGDGDGSLLGRDTELREGGREVPLELGGRGGSGENTILGAILFLLWWSLFGRKRLVSCGVLFDPVGVKGYRVGGEVIVTPVYLNFNRFGNSTARTVVGCCRRHTGKNANLVVARVAEIGSGANTSSFNRLTTSDSEGVPSVTHLTREVRGRSSGVFIRLRRPNERGMDLVIGAIPVSVTFSGVLPGSTCSGLLCKGVIPLNGGLTTGSVLFGSTTPDRDTGDGFTRDTGETVDGGRVGGVVSRFNSTTLHMGGTNYSNIRLRTDRNCLVRRFLSPTAGAEASRCNNSLRGHVHFLVRVVSSIHRGYNASFPLVMELAISRVCTGVKGPNINCSLSSNMGVTGVLGSGNVSTVSISSTSCSAFGC